MFQSDTKAKKKKWFNSLESKLLLVEIPRTNEKKELSAEQMFASLHGILRSSKDLKNHNEFQEHISFEIVSVERKIRFYVWTPASLTAFVEGQIYAQYPEAQIKETNPDHDYIHKIPRDHHVQITEIGLIEHDTLPIKTFPSFEVDPLAAITATLAKLESDEEVLGIQILTRPIDDSWHKAAGQKINSIKQGKSSILTGKWWVQTGRALWEPPEDSKEAKSEISERDRTRITAIEEKSRKLGYQVKIRLIYSCPTTIESRARLKVQALLGAFKQFNSTNLNGFAQTPNKSVDLEDFQTRSFDDKGFVLNIEELASLYHLPHSNVETPNIVWARARTSEPPANLSVYYKGDLSVSPIGRTTFRGDHKDFGLTRNDRGRHIYVIGQTGVGKSALLELLAISDIEANHGFALIDPHGDLAVSTLARIAPERTQDVVYFNPADTEFPIGFNPFEFTDESQKSMIASEIVGALKKMFESWGPRLEYILRYTILSLLEYPGATMLDITRLLTDKSFQKKVVANVTDPVVKSFWTNEYASWNEKYRTEAVAPVLNKVGAFTANPIIRNIVGQSKSGFNIRQIMDEGKILVINLSRGLIGEDNASILGSLLVTKIQLAAMSRADIVNIEDRRPFYLYVDEFQNFATDSFATILSEARKYGLNLTVANQYVSQMPVEVRDAVFGNVGSVISFRVSPDDARVLQKYFEPQFEDKDLTQLHNRDFLANLTIHNEKTVPFSAVTIDLPPHEGNSLDRIIDMNRHQIASTKASVEAIVMQEDSKQNNQQPEPRNNSSHKPNKPAAMASISMPQSPETTPNINPDTVATTTKKRIASSILNSVVITTTNEKQSPTISQTQSDMVKKKRRKRGRKKPNTSAPAQESPLPTSTQTVPAPTPEKQKSLKPTKDDEGVMYIRR